MLAATGALEAPAERRREYAEIVHASGLAPPRRREYAPRHVEDRFRELRRRPGAVRRSRRWCTAAATSCSSRPSRPASSLTRDIARDLPELVADRRACRQILINLLSNAVKFTPKGGRVSVLRAAPARPHRARRRGHRHRYRAKRTCRVSAIPSSRPAPPTAAATKAPASGFRSCAASSACTRASLRSKARDGDGTAVTVSLPIDCRGGGRRGSRASVHAVARRPAKANLLKMGVR